MQQICKVFIRPYIAKDGGGGGGGGGVHLFLDTAVTAVNLR